MKAFGMLGVAGGIVVLLGLAIVATSKLSPTAEPGTGVEGSVMLGPTCPVMREPPDPQCADKPYAGKLALTTADGARVIKEFASDQSGHFSLSITSGTYAIRSAPGANMLPRCASLNFMVIPGLYTSIQVSCDTGIR
jgi:hypothetical protein